MIAVTIGYLTFCLCCVSFLFGLRSFRAFLSQVLNIATEKRFSRQNQRKKSNIASFSQKWMQKLFLSAEKSGHAKSLYSNTIIPIGGTCSGE